MPEIKNDILHELRQKDEPALSASMLADRTDASIKTVNKHLSELSESDRIQTTQIGNATAYYVAPEEQLDKPDFYCYKCDRPIRMTYDYAKLTLNELFRENNTEPHMPDDRVLCRFCYSDFIEWLDWGGEEGNYERVHSWDLPDSQLEDVREDDSVTTAPEEVTLPDEDMNTLLDYLKSSYDADTWIEARELSGELDEYSLQKLIELLNGLETRGYVRSKALRYQLAK